ncbi:CHAD domain-containing protein, partial [Rhizobium ruizarguesonis]
VAAIKGDCVQGGDRLLQNAGGFRDLRKRTYDYRLYHTILRDVWPGAMKAKRDAAKELVVDIGHIHDLTVLSELVEAEPQLFT